MASLGGHDCPAAIVQGSAAMAALDTVKDRHAELIRCIREFNAGVKAP